VLPAAAQEYAYHGFMCTPLQPQQHLQLWVLAHLWGMPALQRLCAYRLLKDLLLWGRDIDAAAEGSAAPVVELRRSRAALLLEVATCAARHDGGGGRGGAEELEEVVAEALFSVQSPWECTALTRALCMTAGGREAVGGMLEAALRRRAPTRTHEPSRPRWC
jgi:hypothetical protein